MNSACFLMTLMGLIVVWMLWKALQIDTLVRLFTSKRIEERYRRKEYVQDTENDK